jgi:fructokinase
MDGKRVIVAVGEVLWDVFPDGPRFGGAPANLACHAAALAADAHMVSRVGDDELGKQALAALREHGVNTECVGVAAEYPTGTVQVELDASGKPRFTIGENVAWDHLQWSEEMDDLAARADAVCFGTLGQRSADSRDVIRRFVAATPPTALRILDVNLRSPFYDEAVIRQSLEAANVLKLSDDELDLVAAAGDVSGSEAETLAGLSRRYELRLVALTRGEHGATLVRGTERSDGEGIRVDVEDTVGAGDAFTAAMTLGLLSNDSLDAINRHACRVAAYVCSQSGATPPLPDELRRGQ